MLQKECPVSRCRLVLLVLLSGFGTCPFHYRVVIEDKQCQTDKDERGCAPCAPQSNDPTQQHPQTQTQMTGSWDGMEWYSDEDDGGGGKRIMAGLSSFPSPPSREEKMQLLLTFKPSENKQKHNLPYNF